MKKKQSKKVRVDFRKNRGNSARRNDLTRETAREDSFVEDLPQSERVDHRGALSRRRTIVVHHEGDELVRTVDESRCLRGRILSAIGSTQCTVAAESGEIYQCTVRRVVRTMSRDERNAVVCGDKVLFEPAAVSGGPATGSGLTGVIERVEPRNGVLSRHHQNREHVIVANITQTVIVGSADQPGFKPALIDRFLVSAGRGGIQPIICINKMDLVDAIHLQPIIGVYARAGYRVIPASAVTGQGIEELRQCLNDQQTVFAGQSGVGKSSLLNAIQPGLGLRTGEVSSVTQKGRHTTRYALLKPIDTGGWIVDTPGIRQLSLWDVLPWEVEQYFVEFRPFVPDCRFPNCLHLYEEGCRVKQAVHDQLISATRYEGYLRMVADDES